MNTAMFAIKPLQARKPIRKAANKQAVMGPKPEKFGEQCTADYMINKKSRPEPIPGEETPPINALVIFDRATKWTEAFPDSGRTTPRTVKALQAFAGSKDVVQSMYVDNAPELLAACQSLGWRCPTSTPGVHESNGLIERVVRKVRDGGRANLVQSGMPRCWWAWAIMHFCATHNAIWRGAEMPPYNARFGTDFPGKLYPFGAAIEFKPNPELVQAEKFENKCVAGVFIGYHIQPGGKWSGDYYCLSMKDIASQKAVPRPTRSHLHRIREVRFPEEKSISFPMINFLKENPLFEHQQKSDPDEINYDYEQDGEDWDEHPELSHELKKVRGANEARQRSKDKSESANKGESPSTEYYNMSDGDGAERPPLVDPLVERPPMPADPPDPEVQPPVDPRGKREYIAGKWQRPYKGTTRVPGYSTEAWHALPYSVREIIARQYAHDHGLIDPREPRHPDDAREQGFLFRRKVALGVGGKRSKTAPNVCDGY